MPAVRGAALVRLAAQGGHLTLHAGQDRAALRAQWRAAWERHRAGLPLEPLQAQMAALVGRHPEYQPLLGAMPSDGEAESSAFMHLALHMALAEQLGTDRPPGIRALRERLAAREGDTHVAEHRMMDVLARVLWDAQRSGQMPDERAYFESLRRLEGAIAR